LPVAPVAFPYQRQLVKPYVMNWISNPRRSNRTRWVDIADHAGPGSASSGAESGAAANEGGFWDWLTRGFSGEAWSKWWNS
jgi:hypothetical protein